MQIVIDIPENEYEWIKRASRQTTPLNRFCVKAIANGIPLPKGHGRLIDADALWECQYCIDGGDYHDDYHVVDIEDIRNALTIIEAEGE